MLIAVGFVHTLHSMEGSVYDGCNCCTVMLWFSFSEFAIESKSYLRVYFIHIFFHIWITLNLYFFCILAIHRCILFVL